MRVVSRPRSAFARRALTLPKLTFETKRVGIGQKRAVELAD